MRGGTIEKKFLNKMQDFASDGLRTLCLAWREIPPDEYEEWNKKFHEANVAIDEREKKV